MPVFFFLHTVPKSSVMSARCTECHIFFPSGAALKRHLSQAKKCGSTQKRKTRAMFGHLVEMVRTPQQLPRSVAGVPESANAHDMTMNEEWPLNDMEVDIPDFIEGSSSGQPRMRDILQQETVPKEVDTTKYQYFPEPAGKRCGKRSTRWKRMRDQRVAGQADRWGGFGSQEHWELARWMIKSGLSQREIDNYLKLPIVSI
jgi:hypothetical protein